MPNLLQRFFGIPDAAPPPPPAPEPSPADIITSSFTNFALRNPEQAQHLYGLLNPTSPTHANALAVLRQSLDANPDAADRIVEQINSTAIASSPTQEDWYWGRLATGDEEDYYWRRLSDNWYQKDVISSTFLEIHKQCYEAYNANPLAFSGIKHSTHIYSAGATRPTTPTPLAFAVVEITVSFVLGKGVKVVATNKKVQ